MKKYIILFSIMTLNFSCSTMTKNTSSETNLDESRSPSSLRCENLFKSQSNEVDSKASEPKKNEILDKTRFKSQRELTPELVLEIADKMEESDVLAIVINVKNNPKRFARFKELFKQHGINDVSYDKNYNFRYSVDRLKSAVVGNNNTSYGAGEILLNLDKKTLQSDVFKNAIKYVREIRPMSGMIETSLRSGLRGRMHSDTFQKWEQIKDNERVEVGLILRQTIPLHKKFLAELAAKYKNLTVTGKEYNEFQHMSSVEISGEKMQLAEMMKKYPFIEIIQIR